MAKFETVVLFDGPYDGRSTTVEKTNTILTVGRKLENKPMALSDGLNDIQRGLYVRRQTNRPEFFWRGWLDTDQS